MWNLGRLVIVLALALGVRGVIAQEAQQEEAPLPPTQHETVAQGTLPDLTGRWLVLADLQLQGRNRTHPSFWTIRAQPEGLMLEEHFVTLPEAMGAKVETMRQNQETWQPSEEELAEIRESWASLPDQKRGVATVKNELWGPDAFTEEHASEEKTKDAVWVVRQTYRFHPGGQRPVTQVNVLGGMTETDAGYTGNYSAVAVAAAPFPIPIPYEGTFRMLRLDPKPERSLMQRIGDLFAGCGR